MKNRYYFLIFLSSLFAFVFFECNSNFEKVGTRFEKKKKSLSFIEKLFFLKCRMFQGYFFKDLKKSFTKSIKIFYLKLLKNYSLKPMNLRVLFSKISSNNCFIKGKRFKSSLKTKNINNILIRLSSWNPIFRDIRGSNSNLITKWEPRILIVKLLSMKNEFGSKRRISPNQVMSKIVNIFSIQRMRKF